MGPIKDRSTLSAVDGVAVLNGTCRPNPTSLPASGFGPYVRLYPVAFELLTRLHLFGQASICHDKQFAIRGYADYRAIVDNTGP